MDTLTAPKKAVLFLGQFLVAAIVYGIVIYLLDIFFESGHRYSLKSIAIQSIVFGFLYTLFSIWLTNRRLKKEKAATK